MIPVYLLKDERLHEAAELDSWIASGGPLHYVSKTMTQLELIQEDLQDKRRGVIVFSASPTEIPLVMQKARLALPGVAGVALVDSADADRLTIPEFDCQLLKRPADKFAFLSALASAARQSELLATVNDSAQLDEVTNLFNRRYYIKRLAEEISLAKRHLTPLCTVVISLNFYQGFLDSYGYDFISQYVRFLAEKVTACVRTEDLVARISDDEIGILLPRSTEKGAKSFTNRLVLELNASKFSYGSYEEEVTVCAGVAGFPLPDNEQADADTLIRYARHALHQAKCSEDEHIRVQLFSEIQPAL